MKNYWQRLNKQGGVPVRRWFTLGLSGVLLGILVGHSQPTIPVTPSTGNVGATVAKLTVSQEETPIDQFRYLLSASPTERSRLLADKPQDKKMVILAKIAQYSTMSEEERELRLHVLQLRWYLEPLMQIPAANRAPLLAAIPASYRSLVEDRLKEWDLLPSALQKDILEGETTRQYFIRWEASKPAQRSQILAALPPANRKELADRMIEWQAMTPAQRKRAADQFNHYFELTTDEQKKALEKTLRVMSATEQQEMEQVLTTYRHLTLAQRQFCLDAFRKFANLSPSEREVFLLNAERWREISAEERKRWRNLVFALTPPLPPGMPLPAIPPPVPESNQ